MALKQIPNLPPVLGLVGNEQIELVQAGVSSRAAISQIEDWFKTRPTDPRKVSIHVGSTPPVPASDGQLWFYTVDSAGGGALYVYYNDGNTVQWVAASPGGGASVVTSATAPDDPSDGDLWWDSTSETLFIYYGDSGQWVPASPPAPSISTGTTINFDALLTGPDTADPMTQMQAIFNSGELEHKHIVFGSTGRRYVFTTRPSGSIYLITPQNCTLEWAAGCEWDFTAYPVTNAIRQYLTRAGTIGPAIKLTAADLVKGQRTVVVSVAGSAASLKPGDRVILHATTQQTNLVGAFTLVDGNPVPIEASISGTTLNVTDVTDVASPEFPNPPANPLDPLSALDTTLKVDTEIAGVGVLTNTLIVEQLTSTETAPVGKLGGTGTYRLNNNHTVAVPSSVLISARGYAARAEDLIVKDVVGDTVTFRTRFRDNYPAITTPVIKLVSNEPHIRLINCTARGRGFDASLPPQSSGGPSQQDRFALFRRTRNFIMEGGKIENFGGLAANVYGSFGGVMRDLHCVLTQDTLAGGGIGINDGTTNFLVHNCATFGGSQPYMLSGQGDAWGVMRDVTFRDCTANGSAAGFTQHNMHEDITYDNCRVNSPSHPTVATGSGFDIRVRGVTMTNCRVNNCNGSAVVLRPGASDFVCDGLNVYGSRTGIILSGGLAEEEVLIPPDQISRPGNITIRNSVMKRIGGAGSGGALSFQYDLQDTRVDPPIFPVLGTLRLTNNYITMTDQTVPIEVRGKWTSPVIEGNTVVGEGSFVPVTTVLIISAPTGGTTGDGPSNPIVHRNTRSSGYTSSSISGYSGVVIVDPQEAVGLTTTSPISLTADTTLTLTENGQTFHNSAATGTVNVLLPRFNLSIQRFEFYVMAAQTLNIYTQSAGIRIGTIVPSMNLRSNVVGAWCRLTLFKGTMWMAETDNPANWTQDWSPYTLDTNLLAWWDVMSPPSDRVGASFRWTDIVGGEALIQDDELLKPVYDGAAVDFAGDKHLRGFQPIPDNFPIGNAPGCIWASVDQTVAASDVSVRHIFDYGDDDYDNARLIGRTVSGGVNRAVAGVGDGTAKTAILATVDFSGLHWAATIYNGTGFFCRSDGASSGTVASVGATTNTRMRMGTNNAASGAFFNAKIKRVMVTKLLSAPDQALLEAWLTAHL